MAILFFMRLVPLGLEPKRRREYVERKSAGMQI
jgi:hypothetical protein